jgi:hypothetical protein
LFWAIKTPHKAHTPLVIYSDTVLTRAISSKLLQAITWLRPQVSELDGIIKHL